MKKILLTIFLFSTIAFNAQTNTFNDTTGDKTWETAGNWSLGIIPTAAHDVVIPAGKDARIKVSGALANTITVESSGKLQVNAGKSLTVTGNVTTNASNGLAFGQGNTDMGTLSYGGVYSGPTIYATFRLPNNNKWHLICSPFKGATFNNTINANNSYIVSKDIDATAGVDQRFSIGSYNDGNAAGAKYTYFTDPLPNTTDQFTNGQGYALLLDNSGNTSRPDFVFRGKPRNEGNVNSPAISDAGSGFNLIGNPYLTYIFANSDADATNNILTVNTSKLAQETIWFWDSASDAFVTINQTTAYHVPPVQGFFVKAKAGETRQISFTPAMQTQTKTNGFRKTSNSRFEINLLMNSGDIKRKTEIKYIDSKTTGFDNGYDSSIFGGYSSEFNIYTQLVGNNQGENLAIQSLPNSKFEDMVIPVGVNATADSEITFSAEALNVPTGLKVFLEDRLNNTFTRLDETSATYKITLTEALNGVGRFYIHTTESALSIDAATVLNNINVYKSNASNLRIVGLQQGKTNVKLFNVLGKQVLNSTFQANGVKDFSISKFANGVYILQLQTASGKLNKKIILE